MTHVTVGWGDRIRHLVPAVRLARAFEDLRRWVSPVERIVLLLNLATIGLVVLIVAHAAEPELLLNAMWVTIAVGAFVFGLRQTIGRIIVFTTIVAVLSTITAANGTEAELFELTEWPLMIVISLIVAVLADRLNITARHYARLYRQASDRLVTAHEEERRRIARDLHDGVGQKLTATILSLDAAEAGLGGMAPLPARAHAPGDRVSAARGVINLARQHAVAALDEVREVCSRLRPPRLSEIGLGSALLELADSVGIPVEVRFRPSILPAGLLDPDREIDAYRIVQEALGNAARHSRASQAWLDAEVADGVITIQIGDNGLGFDPSVTPVGLGLAGMDERASILQGRLDIRSAPGMGTRLELEIPLLQIGTGREPASPQRVAVS
jgi:signal transduction histidine kinase